TVGYVMNFVIPGQPLAAIPQQSACMLLLEYLPGWPVVTPFDATQAKAGGQVNFRFRHSGSMNILFLDNHVEGDFKSMDDIPDDADDPFWKGGGNF
ncbi:MAG TPA: hypothetical protein VF184_02395, partial [Phycisphaeraceae bacterium]